MHHLPCSLLLFLTLAHTLLPLCASTDLAFTGGCSSNVLRAFQSLLSLCRAISFPSRQLIRRHSVPSTAFLLSAGSELKTLLVLPVSSCCLLQSLASPRPQTHAALWSAQALEIFGVTSCSPFPAQIHPLLFRWLFQPSALSFGTSRQ
jgi:hypothetical protein